MHPVIMHVNLAKGFRGGERQTELLIRHLSQQGFSRQYLVCRANSPLREHLSDVTGILFITANHQLQGHRQAPDVDMIHAHEAKAVHWAFIEHLVTGKPYILTRRVPQLVKANIFNRICYRSASTAVGISTPIRKHLEQRDWCPVAQIPSALAHLPTHSDTVQALKKEYAGQFVIGHAGALVDKHKGQRVLMAAARIVNQHQSGITFICLGDGADREELQQESQDIVNFKWLGFHSNLADYLSIMDLFVFPSRNEGLGSTLLDVMDYKVPIIATNVDGIPDIVQHQKTGILIEKDDEQGLAAAILDLIAAPTQRQKLAAQAFACTNHFSPEMMAQRYQNLYEKLLK